MNFIEINKILEKGMKIRRKEWIPQGSQASGMIYLTYTGNQIMFEYDNRE